MDPDATLINADKDNRSKILATLAPARPEPGLYLVATPIGHASDITLRALGVLATADALYCEDTRVTGKLMRLYGISQKLEPYHEHNAARIRPRIEARLAAGEVVALVSDAGTPAISDPGFRLAAEMRAAGHPVTACPGANAAITGLILSGAPTNRFLFVGFLPSKSGGRANTLQELKAVPATQIFYESPKRLAQSLAQMAEILGDRPAAVCRELTKKFEEVRQGTLQELADHYQAAGAPKGEIVIVAGPPLGAGEIEDGELKTRLEQALAQDSLKDAVARIVEETDLPRKRVYRLALDLKSATEKSTKEE